LLLDPALVKCLGYSYTTTMTLSFIKVGRFVKFVPIKFQARAGKSKVRRFRDILRTLQLMTEVLITYNPLKLFSTLALLPALAALACAAISAYCGKGVWLICAHLNTIAALLCFVTGCVLDSIRIHAR